jgi:hypothetical protein
VREELLLAAFFFVAMSSLSFENITSGDLAPLKRAFAKDASSVLFTTYQHCQVFFATF